MQLATRGCVLSSLLCALASMAPAQPAPLASPPGIAPEEDQDTRRIAWVRPFARALEKARETKRILLVKPLRGGSNTPDPDGIPCGGTKDCEGSW